MAPSQSSLNDLRHWVCQFNPGTRDVIPGGANVPERSGSSMAGLITTIRDTMNPHVRFVISSPDEQEITAGQMKHILKRTKVISWGWQITDERIAFRVYKPHRYTTKGVLEEAGVEFD